MCSYDIADALGAICHERIRQSLMIIRLDDGSIDITSISIQKRTRQGDPLSPIFYICLMEVSSSLHDLQPVTKSGQHDHLLFADDLIILSSNATVFRQLHQRVVAYMNHYDQELSASKCCYWATIFNGHNKRPQDPKVQLKIGGARMQQIPLQNTGGIWEVTPDYNGSPPTASLLLCTLTLNSG